jgi:hypothetical protein
MPRFIRLGVASIFYSVLGGVWVSNFNASYNLDTISLAV